MNRRPCTTDASAGAHRSPSVLDAAYQATPERFIRRAPKAPPVPTAAGINKPTTTEEAAQEEPTWGVSPGLDRLRSVIADAGNPRTTIDGAADSTRGF